MNNPACTVYTAKEFEDHNRTPSNPYPKDLTGAFDVSGSTLHIAWVGGADEYWTISSPSSDLTKLSFLTSDYSADRGYGYGSNAYWSTTSYASITEIFTSERRAYAGPYVQNNYGTTVAGFTTLNLGPSMPWQQCGLSCLKLIDPTSSCSACSVTPKFIVYYLAFKTIGRRNYYEHWCSCGTPSTCYNGNAHVKPMLQIIGDNEGFHGWVGAEASLYSGQAGAAYLGLFYLTDVP